jgi:hypothetical protein
MLRWDFGEVLRLMIEEGLEGFAFISMLEME